MEQTPLRNTCDIKTKGMQALYDLARDLNQTVNIKFFFKRYSFTKEGCTINICNKTFTEFGDDCLEGCIKKVCVWAVNTFACFSHMRDAINEMVKPDPMCHVEPIEFPIIPQKTSSTQ